MESHTWLINFEPLTISDNDTSVLISAPPSGLRWGVNKSTFYAGYRQFWRWAQCSRESKHLQPHDVSICSLKLCSMDQIVGGMGGHWHEFHQTPLSSFRYKPAKDNTAANICRIKDGTICLTSTHLGVQAWGACMQIPCGLTFYCTKITVLYVSWQSC